MKHLLLCATLILLPACTHVPRTVEVPVAVPCPPPPPVARPTLPIDRLTGSSTSAEIVRAYVVTVQKLIDYARELEILLDGYRSENESALQQQ